MMRTISWSGSLLRSPGHVAGILAWGALAMVVFVVSTVIPMIAERNAGGDGLQVAVWLGIPTIVVLAVMGIVLVRGVAKGAQLAEIADRDLRLASDLRTDDPLTREWRRDVEAGTAGLRRSRVERAADT